MTVTRFRQVTDGIDIEKVIDWSYDEAPIEVTDLPRFSMKVPLEGGMNAYFLEAGGEIEIRRAGEKVFTGLITQSTPMGADPPVVEVKGVHKGYHLLRKWQCDDYDFDEDGDPNTTRDGVTVNPWAFRIYREPDSTLDSYGNGYPVHGVSVTDGFRALCGTRFVYQHVFEDNTHLLASDVYSTSNKIQVSRDGPSGDKSTALQRVRKDGSGFLAGAQDIESAPLMNGDPYIRGMGDISNVDVVLIGSRSGTQDPSISVCRDAGDASGAGLVNNASRTYSAISLTHVANYNGSGMSAWTGSVNIGGDAAVEKGMLGYRISIAGNDGDAATTKINYISLIATTVSDIDLTEGTAETYDNGEDIVDDEGTLLRGGAVGDEQDWLEGDFLGMRRHEAIERLRATTESAESANTSPHWDFHIDGNLAYHFQERRGTDKTREYSIAKQNIIGRPRHEFWAEEVAYQTIAYGPGSGSARTRIVNKRPFATGGLYDPDRDPTTGAATETKLANVARVMEFVDSEEQNLVALNRKARAFHKLHRNFIEKFSVDVLTEHIRFFETGDGILLKDIPTRTNDTVRVVGLRRKGSGTAEEKLTVTLGEPSIEIRGVVAGGEIRNEAITLRAGGTTATTGVSGSGTYFDKDNFGVYNFGIVDGKSIDTVHLKMTTVPWQATGRGITGSQKTAEAQKIYRDTSARTFDSTDFVDIDNPGSFGGGTNGLNRVTVTIHNQAASSNAFTYNIQDADGTPTDIIGTDLTATLALGETRVSSFILEDSVMPATKLRLKIKGGTVGNVSSPVYDTTYIKIEWATLPKAPIDFGIFQFDGDGNDGTGNPVYGSGIAFAVDPPTVDAFGIPTNFAAESRDGGFGIYNAPQTVEVEVTGYLATEADDTIKNGEHKVFFQSTADAGNGNADGLAVVSVTPIIKFKQVNQ